MTRAGQIKALLSPGERRVFKKLSTPQKIQDFLNHFPVRRVRAGEPNVISPRRALKIKQFHCMDGAVLAAVALAYHGYPPLLMDLQSTGFDLDHVVAPFKQDGLWGAVSKTNHPVLRWRDPVYASPRELAMSYFAEYFWPDQGPRLGTKTMTAYSSPFNLARYNPKKLFVDESLDWLAEALDESPHYPALPAQARKNLRRADAVQITAARLSEWPKKSK